MFRLKGQLLRFQFCNYSRQLVRTHSGVHRKYTNYIFHHYHMSCVLCMTFTESGSI